MRHWYANVPCPNRGCEGRVIVSGKDDHDRDYGPCSDCGVTDWTDADKSALTSMAYGREEHPDPRAYDGPDTLKELT